MSGAYFGRMSPTIYRLISGSVYMKTRLSALLFAVILIVVPVSGCGEKSSGSSGSSGGSSNSGGTTGGGGDAASSDATAPEFAGVVMAYSTYTDRVEVAWVDATDDTTAAPDMRYEIYMVQADQVSMTAISDASSAAVSVKSQRALSSRAQKAIVRASTAQVDMESAANISLLTSPQYRTAFEDISSGGRISGLKADTDYYLAAVAVDAAGNRSTPGRITGVKTLARDIALSVTPVDLSAADSGLSKLGVDHYMITAAEAASLSAGSVLLVDDGSGPTLKQVTYASASAAGVEVSTRSVTLEDIITDGGIESSVTMVGLDGLPSDTAQVSANALGQRVRKYSDPSGRFKITESWQSDQDGATTTGRLQAASTDWTQVSSYPYSAQLGNNLQVGFAATMQPTLATSASWEWFALKSVNAKLTGEVDLRTIAALNFPADFGDGYTYSKTLFTRTQDLTYWVGVLPVYQQVKLEIIAEVNLEPEAEVNTAVLYHANKKLNQTVNWTSASGFSSADSGSFTQELGFDVEVAGSVIANVKVYPKVTSTFYSTAGFGAAIQPGLELDAAATLNPLPNDPVTFEFTRFNVDFILDYLIDASFKAFGKTLGEWENSNRLYNYTLFSLPEIEMSCPDLSIADGETMQCTVSVTDGVNNAVPGSNIQWTVPSGLSAALSSDQKTATVTGQSSGSQLLKVSAYGSGALGTWGKRYDYETISVERVDSDGDGYYAYDDDCDDSNAAINPMTVWFKDADGDGYSDGTTTTQCAQATGYYLSTSLTATAGDCNDGSAAYKPTTVWYKDTDGDGYSDGTTATQCSQTLGYSLETSLIATNGDVNDSNAAIQTQNVASGLMAYYSFTGNANDSSGNGNNGTVSGAALATGHRGTASSAYTFDGVNDYVSVPDSSSLDLTSQLTFSAWVQPANITANTYYEILRKDATASGYLFSFQGGGTLLTIGINSNGSYESNTPITPSYFTDGAWHFVVGTYDGTQFKVYADGALLGTTAVSGAIGTNASPLYIGSSKGVSEFFSGKIDEVRIHNRVLTSSEIAYLYTQ